jgi:hypothetical protein
MEMDMTDENRSRRSLRDFDPYTDRNGQDNGEDSALDVAHAAATDRQLACNPNGEAETARLASGRPNLGATDADGTEATEAEVPRETIERMSNPSLSPRKGKGA